MRLLFDQNLSPLLVRNLIDLFPDSNHVFPLGLAQLPDTDVWEYARKNEFIIVSKDVDFSELIAMRGFPPKLIWLRTGNCNTQQIETSLRSHFEVIQEMNKNQNIGILSLL